MKKYKLKRILYLIVYSLKWMCLFLSTSVLGILLIPLMIELIGKITTNTSIFGKYLTIATTVVGIVFGLGIIFSIIETIIIKSGKHFK